MTDISGARRKDIETYREPKRAAQRVIDADFGLVDEDDARIVARALLSHPQRDGEGDRGLDAAASPVDPWQPISTAPKDGRLILTMLVTSDPGVAFWVEREKAWCFASYDHEHKARGYMGGRAIPSPQPTHWQPLPAPPGADANQQSKTGGGEGMSDQPKCGLCGKPMPTGEEMFKYHGFSGSCPAKSGPVELLNPIEGPSESLPPIFSRGRLVEIWKEQGGAIDKKGRAWIEVDLLVPLLNSVIERAAPFIVKERDPNQQSKTGGTQASDSLARISSSHPEDGGIREAPIFAFLLGEGPLEGYWFGDRRPSGKRHPENFWWRKHLRAALNPAPLPIGEEK